MSDGKATIDKFKQAYERDKEKVEALEKAMKKGLSNALKNEDTARNVGTHFAKELEKSRSDPFTPQRRKIEGFGDNEPDPTGYEKYPWQEDDEE